MSAMQRLPMTWLLLTACALGCGGSGRPKLVSVTGTVTLDGKPLEGAIVAFLPDVDAKAKYKRPSSGITDASGKFTLGTYDKTDGAPVGKYKVGIQKREPTTKLPENFNSEVADQMNITYKWVTPREAADPQGSGLTAEVTSSGLKPDTFDLKASAQPEIERTGPQVRANDP
jgi:hypothetical protein